jgi:hypothetical protein
MKLNLDKKFGEELIAYVPLIRSSIHFLLLPSLSIFVVKYLICYKRSEINDSVTWSAIQAESLLYSLPSVISYFMGVYEQLYLSKARNQHCMLRTCTNVFNIQVKLSYMYIACKIFLGWVIISDIDSYVVVRELLYFIFSIRWEAKLHTGTFVP